MNERRTLILLAVLLLGQLTLLAAQVPDGSARGSNSLLESVALAALAPVAHGVAVVFDGGVSLRQALRSHGRLEEEVGRLESENRELDQRLFQLQGLESEMERLSEALAYEPPSGASIAVADVTYVDHVSWLRTLVLRLPVERRQSGGIGLSSPVCAPDGLVGRVVGISGDFLRVQMITDRASSVGAMLERTRRQGIVRGADGGLLALDYVPRQAEVRVGDRVVTAGIDGVYPRGIEVGTVVEVDSGDDLFYRIRVAPTVDFGRLDQAYVLSTESMPDHLRRPEIGDAEDPSLQTPDGSPELAPEEAPVAPP